jgi:hypothetical protein
MVLAVEVVVPVAQVFTVLAQVVAQVVNQAALGMQAQQTLAAVAVV